MLSLVAHEVMVTTMPAAVRILSFTSRPQIVAGRMFARLWVVVKGRRLPAEGAGNRTPQKTNRTLVEHLEFYNYINARITRGDSCFRAFSLGLWHQREVAALNNTRHVVNTLLQRAFKEGRTDVSPMKAQKLLFYTHGWHLATTGRPAIDMPFLVWPYGPVVSDVYHDLKKFGSGAVTSYITAPGEDRPYVINPDNKSLYESLDIAWEKYIGIPAVNLSAMTHEPGSPWDIARNRGMSQIPNELIRDYFVRTATN